MRNKRINNIGIVSLAIILLAWILPNAAIAATSPWVEDQYSKARLVVGGKEDGQYYAGVEIVADKGWKMYWRTPGDAGFPPTMDWSETDIKSADIKWPVPKRDIERFDGGELESYVYKDRLFLPIVLQPETKDALTTLNLRLDYGVCKEICIPANANFNLAIPQGHVDEVQLSEIKTALANAPKTLDKSNIAITQQQYFTKNGKQYIAVQAKSDEPFQSPDMFLESQGLVKFSAPDVEYDEEGGVTFYSEVTSTMDEPFSLAGEVLQVTLVNGKNAVETDFIAGELEAQDSLSGISPLLILWFAFLGGLILNIMPCVLPVLSIKLLGILQQGGAAMQDVRRSFIASALGILTSFMVLAGITIALKETGQAVGWGFHFQNPIFLIVLVVLLVLFASNLIGRFEVNLPGGVTDFLIHKTPLKHHSLLGDFTAGVFATILATPCTAPFLGTAVSFALSRGVIDILTIFGMMGLGLAFPYLLFSIFPRWVAKLPKPGAWMVKLKYVLSILLLLTAIWLLWVLSHNLGMRAAVVVFLSVLLIKFFVELKGRVWLRLIGFTAVLAIIFTIPFAVMKQDDARKTVAEQMWVEFDEAAIPGLVDDGRVVFVDVTADWCVTCKFNKLWVLDRMDVMERFKSLDVVAMKADITQPEPAIQDYLKRHERYGIPFNIVYGPDAKEGIVLSELLSRKEVNLALKQAAGEK